MRDRSAKRSKSGTAGGGPGEAPTCLAEFTLNSRKFQLMLCKKEDVRPAVEVARFDLGDSTVAVVEEANSPAAQDIVARLTGRELQIAALVAAGHATKNIAYELSISEWTVGTHMRRIFAKLNVDNRAAMVYLCAPCLQRTAPAGPDGGRRERQSRTSLKPGPAHPMHKARAVDLVDL
jgi:DNA-binding CsgD family transcriptional regulator